MSKKTAPLLSQFESRLETIQETTQLLKLSKDSNFSFLRRTLIPLATVILISNPTISTAQPGNYDLSFVNASKDAPIKIYNSVKPKDISFNAGAGEKQSFFSNLGSTFTNAANSVKKLFTGSSDINVPSPQELSAPIQSSSSSSLNLLSTKAIANDLGNSSNPQGAELPDRTPTTDNISSDTLSQNSKTTSFPTLGEIFSFNTQGSNSSADPTFQILPTPDPRAYLSGVVGFETQNQAEAQSFDFNQAPNAPLANTTATDLTSAFSSLLKNTTPQMSPVDYTEQVSSESYLDESSPANALAQATSPQESVPEQLDGYEGSSASKNSVSPSASPNETTNLVSERKDSLSANETPSASSTTPTTEAKTAKTPPEENSLALNDSTPQSNKPKAEAPSEPNTKCEIEENMASVQSGSNAQDGCANNVAFLDQVMKDRSDLVATQALACSDHDYQLPSGKSKPFKLEAIRSEIPSICQNGLENKDAPTPAEIQWFKERQENKLIGSGASAQNCDTNPAHPSCCLLRAEKIAALDSYLYNNRTTLTSAATGFCKNYENYNDERNTKRHLAENNEAPI
ncbi:hypothetical protein GW915_09345 [bacterium]|nr:hypothetical protein [bacterium]